jgi:hypothetical protein
MGSVMHRGSIGTKGGAKKNKEREKKEYVSHYNHEDAPTPSSVTCVNLSLSLFFLVFSIANARSPSSRPSFLAHPTTVSKRKEEDEENGEKTE